LRVICSALDSALDNAVKSGLVARNVAKLVDLPQVERYEGQILTEDQARKLLEVAHGSRLDVLLLVALTTGMRRGELVALHWSDLDYEKGVLQVRRNVSRMPGVGLVEREPKTKAGRRKIVLSDVVLAVLKEHEVIQQELRKKAGGEWEEHGLIFSNIYGRLFNPNHVWYLFKKLLKKAGLPNVRFHDLRHSVATILLVAKIDLKVVSELLGHSSIAVTADIYAHVLPEMQREVIHKMDSLFKRS
jgi:integrase